MGDRAQLADHQTPWRAEPQLPRSAVRHAARLLAMQRQRRISRRAVRHVRRHRTGPPDRFLSRKPAPVSRPYSRRRREEELLDALERAVTPRRRTLLPARIWAWRKELALAVGIAVLFVAVVRTSSLVWAVVGLSAAVGAFSPPWSEQLKAFGWRLVTPHRLRAGLYHARIENRSGRRPMIVRVTGEPFGERLLLRCPAGTSAEDI